MTALQSSYGLSNCPVGGGVEACFIFRWFTAVGIQLFQPPEIGEYDRNPYDSATFRKDLPVHKFRKETVPADWSESGTSDLWVRIE